MPSLTDAERMRSYYRPTPPVDQEELQRDLPPPFPALQVATHRSGAVTATPLTHNRLRRIETSQLRETPPRRWSRGRSRRPATRRTRSRTVGARGDPHLSDDDPSDLDPFQAEDDAWDEIGLESLGEGPA
jgi:hypothetical protein